LKCVIEGRDLMGELREQITARILKETNLDAQVEEAYRELGKPDPQQTDTLVRGHLENEKADLWKVPIELQSDELLNGAGRN
jgi:hypothetical protein